MARINQAAVRRLLHDPRGPVGVDLLRRGHRIRNQSRVFTPVRTGRLRAAQTVAGPFPVPTGLVVQVGSNITYSRAVHDGSASPYAPPSWKAAHARGRPVPARRFLTNALPAGRG